jgi:hypothetical protein
MVTDAQGQVAEVLHVPNRASKGKVTVQVIWTLAFLAVLRWLTQQALQDRKIITQCSRFLAGRL